MEISVEKVPLDAGAVEGGAGGGDGAAVSQSRRAQRDGTQKAKTGEADAAPGGKRRQGERQHEPVVEAIGEKREDS